MKLKLFFVKHYFFKNWYVGSRYYWCGYL